MGTNGEGELEKLFASYVDRLNNGEELDPETILAENPIFGAEIIEYLDDYMSMASPQGSHRQSIGTYGDYTLRCQIGRGGMGVVYEAWQNSVDRQVALKVLPAGISADTKMVTRFVREARVAAKLSHPNVVSVYGMGVEAETPYYAMEYVEGVTLAQILAKKKDGQDKLPFGDPETDQGYYTNLGKVFAEVSDGLQHAHSKGVYHRDIKPSNLILDQAGRLRILDFGLARLEGQETLTASGEFFGTPLYMSPEQAMARRIPIDHRTDIYSLGATMYEMLAWRPPFHGKNHQETLSQIIFRDPEPLRRQNPRVPRELETVVLKCLRKDPADRYGTAEALEQDLRRFVRGDPIEARPQSGWERLARRAWRNKLRIATAACAIVLVLATGFLLYRQQRLEQVRIQRERAAEYDARVRSDVLKIQLAKFSLRERENLERSFNIRRVGRYSLDALNLESARGQLESAVNDLQGTAGLKGAIHLFPKKPEGYYHLATGLALLSRAEEARDALERVLALDPQFTAARKLREALLATGGDPENLKPLLEMNPSGGEPAPGNGKELYLGANLERLFEEGFVHLESGDTARALKNFIRACDLAPGAMEPALLEGKAWYLRGEREMAEELFQGLLEKSPPENKSKVAHAVAMVYAFLKDTEKVIEWAKWVEPANLRARLKASTLMYDGKFQQALEEAERAVKLAPEEYRTHLTLGEILGLRLEWEKAARAFREAYRLNKTDRWVRAFLGSSLMTIPSTRGEGMQLLEELKKDHPRWPFVHFTLGHVHYGLYRSSDTTIKHYREAIRPEPGLLFARLGLGNCLADRGQFQEAHEQMDAAIALRTELPVSRLGKAYVFYVEGKHEKAVEFFSKFLELKERFPEAVIDWEWFYALYGVSLLHIGKVEEANEMIRKAEEYLQGKKDVEKYLEGIGRYPGWIYLIFGSSGHYLLGNYKEGVLFLEKALAAGAGEKNPGTYIWTAKAYEKLGDVQNALGKVVQALERDPEWRAFRDDPLSDVARLLGRDPSLQDDPEMHRRISELLRRQETIRPGDPRVLHVKAIISAHSGDLAGAARFLEGALRQPNAKRALEERLERLRKSLGFDYPSYTSIDAALRELAFENLVPREAEWNFFRGTEEPSSDLGWVQVDFANSWKTGVCPIGYGEPGITTPLEGMKVAHTTVYLRHEFQVADREPYRRLLLSVTADDGFIAYLNGKEVLRVNVRAAEGSIPYDAVASTFCLEPHAPVDVWLEPELLLPGKNVLAIQGLNFSTESSDFLLAPLLRGEVSPKPESWRELAEKFQESATGKNRSYRIAYMEGRIFQLKGKYEEARKKFEQVIREDAEHAEPWLRLAECLVSLGRAPEAEERLSDVLNCKWAARERRLWDAWIETCLVKLELKPKEVLARFPDPASPDAQPIPWLLEKLGQGDSIRINCGGAKYNSQGGVVWEGDRFFTGGRIPWNGSRSYLGEIEGTGDDRLYQTERYFHPNETGNSGYRIPLPPGEYRVTLHFAEIVYREGGERRFDVLVEDEAVLENFEPLEQGFGTVYSKNWITKVRDGFLDIELVPGNGVPKVSAIEVVSESSLPFKSKGDG